VGVDQVLGLVKVIYHLGRGVDAININEAVDADLGDLAHVIDAAGTLGMVKAVGGDLELTVAGRDAVEKPLKAPLAGSARPHARSPAGGLYLFFASTSVMQLCG
jgi:hypothetical protein